MNYKLTFENLSTQEKKNYKTLREIAKDLGIEYHQARSIYLQSTDKKPKFLHPYLQILVSKYKIYNNPELYNTIVH